MSQPAHWWYANVVRTIRSYPALTQEKGAAPIPGMLANSNIPRNLAPMEALAIDAVQRAMTECSERKDGRETLEVVRLYHWKKMSSFERVGVQLNMSATTAKRYNAKFIHAVARNLGYL